MFNPLRTVSICLFMALLLYLKCAISTTCCCIGTPNSAQWKSNSLPPCFWKLAQSTVRPSQRGALIYSTNIIYLSAVCVRHQKYSREWSRLGSSCLAWSPMESCRASAVHNFKKPPSWKLSQLEQKLQHHPCIFLTHHPHSSSSL